ncbi:hypothetical protein RFI_07844 [Reticulomyxa filosa]|uniref:Uncharacterized protein n=1 Tax=Reticulomyxa filosa TaxID=46433 RepID=X6NTG3_RETFI|nr:hypothetical protein RFI_07844 [Reticulomyxa filosa]|eukprot:ETO29281.1 hypothetical protein RFI_07844 [Reticulomyxa filosa]
MFIFQILFHITKKYHNQADLSADEKDTHKQPPDDIVYHNDNKQEEFQSFSEESEGLKKTNTHHKNNVLYEDRTESTTVYSNVDDPTLHTWQDEILNDDRHKTFNKRSRLLDDVENST